MSLETSHVGYICLFRLQTFQLYTTFQVVLNGLRKMWQKFRPQIRINNNIKDMYLSYINFLLWYLKVI